LQGFTFKKHRFSKARTPWREKRKTQSKTKKFGEKNKIKKNMEI